MQIGTPPVGIATPDGKVNLISSVLVTTTPKTSLNLKGACSPDLGSVGFVPSKFMKYAVVKPGVPDMGEIYEVEEAIKVLDMVLNLASS